MPFANAFDVFVKLIEASVAVFSILSVALVILVIVLRTRHMFSARHQEDLTQRWRSIFVIAYTGGPMPALPTIEKRDWMTVLQLFNSFHQLRDSDAHRGPEVFPVLDEIAGRAGLDRMALLLLAKGDAADKIVALNVLGHLRDERALEPSLALMDEDGPELSRNAAQCALRIDAHLIDTVLECVEDRDDWVRSRIEMMIKEVPNEALDPAMARTVQDAHEEGKRRLLDYIRFCSPTAARDICTSVLKDASDPETIAAALRSLAPVAKAEDHATARSYCDHPSTIVLLSALRVLRKCARPEDQEILGRLTSHRDYWVRLRAAEVVVQLYGEAGLVRDFAHRLTDRYARDAVRQAIIESQATARRTPANDRRGAIRDNAREFAIGGGHA